MSEESSKESSEESEGEEELEVQAKDEEPEDAKKATVTPRPIVLQASDFNLYWPTEQIYWHIDQLRTNCRNSSPRIYTNFLSCVIPKTHNKKEGRISTLHVTPQQV